MSAKEWTEGAGYRAVDVRDWDRSALSGVPKRSGPMRAFSHHHRQFRSRRGTHSPANIVLLLGTGSLGEHYWAHSEVDTATVLGYSVPSWKDPASTPIWRLDTWGQEYGWHLQLDDGTLEPTEPPVDYTAVVVAQALAAFAVLRQTSLDAARKVARW